METGTRPDLNRIDQDAFAFTIHNPEDSGSLTVGTQVTMFHYSKKARTVVKVQGTITAVDQARAEFALTQATRRTCCSGEGTPVYLEPSRRPDVAPTGRPSAEHPGSRAPGVRLHR